MFNFDHQAIAMKIKCSENLKHRKFLTQKFPDLPYSIPAYGATLDAMLCLIIGPTRFLFIHEQKVH